MYRIIERPVSRNFSNHPSQATHPTRAIPDKALRAPGRGKRRRVTVSPRAPASAALHRPMPLPPATENRPGGGKSGGLWADFGGGFGLGSRVPGRLVVGFTGGKSKKNKKDTSPPSPITGIGDREEVERHGGGKGWLFAGCFVDGYHVAFRLCGLHQLVGNAVAGLLQGLRG